MSVPVDAWALDACPCCRGALVPIRVHPYVARVAFQSWRWLTYLYNFSPQAFALVPVTVAFETWREGRKMLRTAKESAKFLADFHRIVRVQRRLILERALGARCRCH
jgi:hypothetical protein